MTKYIFLLCLSITICPVFADDAQAVRSSKTLAFIENKGQVTDQYYQPRHDIDFKIDAGNGLSVFVGKGAIHYQFYKEVAKPENNEHKVATWEGKDKGLTYDTSTREIDMYRMDVELVGSNKHSSIIPEGRLGYYENYYTTGTGERGVTVHPYTRITYKDIYPNIDWVLYSSSSKNGAPGSIKYDFVVHPGGNPANIKLRYEGATTITLNEDGSITAVTPQGAITEQAPISYQADRQSVASKYVLQDNVLSFEIGEYSGTLVIDPTLDWGTYFGGSLDERTTEMIVDFYGNINITGLVNSMSNIATTGSHQIQYSGGYYDAFIAQFNNKGQLDWATYYGGSGLETANGLAKDKKGFLYLAGDTDSPNQIATNGSFQYKHSGALDAFLAKFNINGQLEWGTYFGDISSEGANCVAIDKHGFIYMGGYTYSIHNITTTNSHQPKIGGWSSSYTDGFLAKFNDSGVIKWATYYGGFYSESINAIDIDSSDNIFIAGHSRSDTGISTPSVHQTSFAGGSYLGDGFLAKFDTSGKRLWGSYYGGNNEDIVSTLIVDEADNIFIGGKTRSFSGIVTPGAFRSTPVGISTVWYDVFLAKFNKSGTRIWGTYYGGNKDDDLLTVDINDKCNIYIGGRTESSADIASAGAMQGVFGGSRTDGFLAKFDSSGAQIWSTYYGSIGEEVITSLCINNWGIYLTGGTTSISGLVKNGTHQSINAGAMDCFISTLCEEAPISDTIRGPSTICQYSTVKLTNRTPNGIYHAIGNNITVSADGLITGISQGIDTVMYVVANACGIDTAWHEVTILPSPFVTSQPIDVAAKNNSAQFSILAAGANLGYQWQEDSGGGYQSLNNTGQYSGVTTNVLTINNVTVGNSNSKYRCIVTGGNCADTSDAATLYVWPLGISNVEGNEVEIYPNPVSNILTIASDTDIRSVEVLNLYGQKQIVKEGSAKTVEVDMNKLVPGVYIIKVNDGFVSRIVKE